MVVGHNDFCAYNVWTDKCIAHDDSTTHYPLKSSLFSEENEQKENEKTNVQIEKR